MSSGDRVLLRQVWTALLTCVLLRFCAWISKWGQSFTRLFTLVRSALWLKLKRTFD